MIWLFQFAKTGRIKTMAEAIKTFFKYNGRMPSSKEIKNMEGVMREAQGKTADIIQFPKDRITPFHKPRPTKAEIEAEYRRLSSLSPEEVKVEMRKEGLTPVEERPLLKDSPEAIAKIKAENKAAAERLRKKKEAEELFTDERPPKDPDFASGGIARVGYANGSYKSEGLFGIPMEDIRKFKEKERMDRTSPLAIPDDWLQRLLRKFRRTETYEQSMESGGIARVGYAAGKIVKGASWVIKSLKKSRKEVIEGTGRFKNLNSMQQDLLKKELSALIKQLEQGGAIPDEMLQTMRQDKRFKDIVKTPSTDPELRELEEVLLRGQTSDDYLEALDKSIMETMDLTKADLENMSSTVLDDLRRNADPIGMHKHFDEITPGRGVGDFPDDPSKHEDILPDLEQFDVTGKTKHASGGIAGELHLNEGGRVPMIFGGSAGLKGAIAAIKAAINKGRKDKLKTLFPKYSVEEKELLKLGEKYLPRDAANLAAQEAAGKAEGVQVLIDRLKHDKKILEQMAKNKSMNDPGLDFMMKHLEETMYPPHLKKYKNIDKDILQLETIKKNLIMKGRRPNAEGGLAHVLGV